jgi:hypothetical protein
MTEIDGFWWFVLAILICGWHASFILSWRLERRASDAWWRKYDVESRLRHEALMRALARENDEDDNEDDEDGDENENEDEAGARDHAALELDPATQKIVDDFGALAKKRFTELLGRRDNGILQRAAEISFCLGYKAGVIDLGAAQREEAIVDVTRMAAVVTAAIAWRDSPRVDAGSLAGAVNGHEARLIGAIDAARAARKEGSS